MSSHTRTEIVPGNVRRDLRSLAKAIDDIPHFRVLGVGQSVINARRYRRQAGGLSARITVELRQADRDRMEVTITSQIPSIWDTWGHNSNYAQLVLETIQQVQAPFPRTGPVRPERADP